MANYRNDEETNRVPVFFQQRRDTPNLLDVMKRSFAAPTSGAVGGRFRQPTTRPEAVSARAFATAPLKTPRTELFAQKAGAFTPVVEPYEELKRSPERSTPYTPKTLPVMNTPAELAQNRRILDSAGLAPGGPSYTTDPRTDLKTITQAGYARAKEQQIANVPEGEEFKRYPFGSGWMSQDTRSRMGQGESRVASGLNIPQDTLAFRNNNPGNLRFANQPGATQGEGGFAKFETPEAGYKALQGQIGLDASRGHTLRSFINKYAPPSENDTAGYLGYVTKQIGRDENSLLSDIDVPELSNAMMQMESGASIGGQAPGRGQGGAGVPAPYGYESDVRYPGNPEGFESWDPVELNALQRSPELQRYVSQFIEDNTQYDGGYYDPITGVDYSTRRGAGLGLTSDRIDKRIDQSNVMERQRAVNESALREQALRNRGLLDVAGVEARSRRDMANLERTSVPQDQFKAYKGGDYSGPGVYNQATGRMYPGGTNNYLENKIASSLQDDNDAALRSAFIEAKQFGAEGDSLIKRMFQTANEDQRKRLLRISKLLED